jgi:hypothetical protein
MINPSVIRWITESIMPKHLSLHQSGQTKPVGSPIGINDDFIFRATGFNLFVLFIFFLLT